MPSKLKKKRIGSHLIGVQRQCQFQQSSSHSKLPVYLKFHAIVA